jgi:hypothetical protein
MSADAFRGFDDLMAELRRLCAERRTGTLFIATADNEAGQLTLRDGFIVAARFRRKTGLEAAHGLRKLSRTRFMFTRDFVDSTDHSLSSTAVMAVLTDTDVTEGLADRDGTIRGLLTAALTEYLGPMAAIVVRDHLRDAERAGRAPTDVVQALAAGIDDPAAAAAFKAHVSAALAARAARRR